MLPNDSEARALAPAPFSRPWSRLAPPAQRTAMYMPAVRSGSAIHRQASADWKASARYGVLLR